MSIMRIDYKLPDSRTQTAIGVNSNHCEFFEDRLEYKSLLKCKQAKDGDVYSIWEERHIESQGFTLRKFIFNVHANYWHDEISEGFTISIYAEADPIKITYSVEQESKYKADYEFIKNWILNK